MTHVLETVDNTLSVIVPSRELETGNRDSVQQLRNLCREQIKKKMNLIIDFNNINICPSLVWGNLLVLVKEVRAQKCLIALCGLRPTLEKTVKIIGMANYIDVFETRKKAIRSILQENGNG